MAAEDDRRLRHGRREPARDPGSAPVRAGDLRILLSLHRTRDFLARLRQRPLVALALLSKGNVAFTARASHGSSKNRSPMHRTMRHYAAVEIDNVEDRISLRLTACHPCHNGVASLSYKRTE